MEMREFGGTGIRASVVGLLQQLWYLSERCAGCSRRSQGARCRNQFLRHGGRTWWRNEESLTRLKTDYIDLYQVHVADPETPREETLRALDDLVRQGKVRALGEAATFATADDLNTSQAIAAANGLTSFATREANCSILVRDAEKAIIQ